MTEDMFNPSSPSPLVGLKVMLEREKNCCRGFAIVHAGKGPHAAELRCAECGGHAGWLPKKATDFLTEALGHFPEAKHDVHVIRNLFQPDRAGGK